MVKSHCVTFPINNNRVDAPFSIIYSNVWGPAPLSTHNGMRWFVIFVDDFSIFCSSFDLCLSSLDIILKRCVETNLMLNQEKCHFMVIEVSHVMAVEYQFTIFVVRVCLWMLEGRCVWLFASMDVHGCMGRMCKDMHFRVFEWGSSCTFTAHVKS